MKFKLVPEVEPSDEEGSEGSIVAMQDLPVGRHRTDDQHIHSAEDIMFRKPQTPAHKNIVRSKDATLYAEFVHYCALGPGCVDTDGCHGSGLDHRVVQAGEPLPESVTLERKDSLYNIMRKLCTWEVSGTKAGDKIVALCHGDTPMMWSTHSPTKVVQDTMKQVKEAKTKKTKKGSKQVELERTVFLNFLSTTWVPTIQMLWNAPFLCFPAIYTNEVVIGKVCKGANVMHPGIIPLPEYERYDKGTIVAILDYANPYFAYAIGYLEKSGIDLLIGTRTGCAVSLLQYIGDEMSEGSFAKTKIHENPLSALPVATEEMKMRFKNPFRKNLTVNENDEVQSSIVADEDYDSHSVISMDSNFTDLSISSLPQNGKADSKFNRGKHQLRQGWVAIGEDGDELIDIPGAGSDPIVLAPLPMKITNSSSNSSIRSSEMSLNGGDGFKRSRILEMASASPVPSLRMEDSNSVLGASEVGSDIEIETRESTIDIQSNATEQQQVSPDEMDELLLNALFEVVKKNFKTEFPAMILSTQLYSDYIQTHRRDERKLDVSKSSFKKLSKWLKYLQSENILKTKVKKDQTMIIGFNYDHLPFREFKPYKIYTPENEPVSRSSVSDKTAGESRKSQTESASNGSSHCVVDQADHLDRFIYSEFFTPSEEVVELLGSTNLVLFGETERYCLEGDLLSSVDRYISSKQLLRNAKPASGNGGKGGKSSGSNDKKFEIDSVLSRLTGNYEGQEMSVKEVREQVSRHCINKNNRYTCLVLPKWCWKDIGDGNVKLTKSNKTLRLPALLVLKPTMTSKAFLQPDLQSKYDGLLVDSILIAKKPIVTITEKAKVQKKSFVSGLGSFFMDMDECAANIKTALSVSATVGDDPAAKAGNKMINVQGFQGSKLTGVLATAGIGSEFINVITKHK